MNSGVKAFFFPIQIYGLDYEEALKMTKVTTVRISFSLTIDFGWEFQQFDVTIVFLHEYLFV